MQLISRLRICIRTSCGVDSQDRLLWDVTRDHQSFWKKEEAPGYRDYSPCLPLTSAFNALGGIWKWRPNELWSYYPVSRDVGVQRYFEPAMASLLQCGLPWRWAVWIGVRPFNLIRSLVKPRGFCRTCWSQVHRTHPAGLASPISAPLLCHQPVLLKIGPILRSKDDQVGSWCAQQVPNRLRVVAVASEIWRKFSAFIAFEHLAEKSNSATNWTLPPASNRHFLKQLLPDPAV